MRSDEGDRLGAIHTFPSLVRYLKEELGWPIHADKFEDVVFDYTPEELGIDKANAAKIEEIKRLRPLVSNQPWGIFFVKFEPKRLPVVALRRILNGVVVKKLASASKEDAVAWQMDDLLFLSSYGEGEARQISFAHFTYDPSDGHLPTLRVLGWDGLDTPLHLNHVGDVLRDKLSWRRDEEDLADWRERWRSAFTLRHREVIRTAKALAEELARLARGIRQRIKTALDIETEAGPVRGLAKAFREALIHDLSDDDFADMYAQTIAYGLLSARITNPGPPTRGGHQLVLPVTNPFLKELMEAFLRVGGSRERTGGHRGIDFDELGVSDVIELLDEADMDAVIRDFGDRNPQEDPVIHFYESFLRKYDAKKRMQRGVFYTPRPVVSFIVRSVDELLRIEFGLEDGLADTTTWGEMAQRYEGLQIPEGSSSEDAFVQILDPAAGTGTFLVEVIDHIHKTMTAKWGEAGRGAEEVMGLWNAYVTSHLLPRVHGYELLMAPYAIAHLKVALKLQETKYCFVTNDRVRVYLTNTLEPPRNHSSQSALTFSALANEAEAVSVVKEGQRFTVVLGNPPYSNRGRLNRNPYILGLLDEYKKDLGEKKINLDDDFVKFVRFAQHVLTRTGTGILGLISNNVYLDGLTHRRMRSSLLGTFSRIHITDLHGNARAQESAGDGGVDENVFDIRQGVAIALMAARVGLDHRTTFCDLRGRRLDKYAALLGTSTRPGEGRALNPCSPFFFLVPRDLGDTEEYAAFMCLTEMFKTRSYGIQTKRDALTMACDQETMLGQARDVLSLSATSLRSKYGLPEDGRDWSVDRARSDLARLPDLAARLQPVLYRPFDKRWTIYTERSRGFLAYPRWSTMKSMRHHNIGLTAMRQVFQDAPSYSHFLVTDVPVDERTFYSNRGGTYLFPLYADDADTDDELFGAESRHLNLSEAYLSQLSTALGGATAGVQAANLRDPSGETVFGWVYAVVHSPTYRSRYAEQLKTDYPRVPLPRTGSLFEALAGLGGKLISLHLMESAIPGTWPVTTVGSGHLKVESISHADGTVWLDRSRTQGFRGVPDAVWLFHMGGYQVCEKWLKDRKGRTLTDGDVAHYRRVVIAISETIRLMGEIDQVIDAFGGWPGAFLGVGREAQ